MSGMTPMILQAAGATAKAGLDAAAERREIRAIARHQEANHQRQRADAIRKQKRSEQKAQRQQRRDLARQRVSFVSMGLLPTEGSAGAVIGDLARSGDDALADSRNTFNTRLFESDQEFQTRRQNLLDSAPSVGQTIFRTAYTGRFGRKLRGKVKTDLSRILQ